jgi:hypothetical protein
MVFKLKGFFFFPLYLSRLYASVKTFVTWELNAIEEGKSQTYKNEILEILQ